MSKVISEMIEKDDDRSRKTAISITLDEDVLQEVEKVRARMNYQLSQKGHKTVSRSQFFESAAAMLVQQMRKEQGGEN